MPITDSPTLARALLYIREHAPKYALKLDAQLTGREGTFFRRAEGYLSAFEDFLESKGKDLEYGVRCHLRLRDAMLDERLEFLRTGHYASSSFAEVEQRVYANPEIMEYYMYGLVFSQFLWPEQYARLEFFCRELPRYRDHIANYLEIGGGHGIYISSAAELLNGGTHFDLVDISATSMELARAMSPCTGIHYHLCDIFDFNVDLQRRYDFIVIGEVLEHLEDPRKLLAKVRGMLSPGGHAFISTPVNAPTADHIHLFHHVREIRDLLASEGCSIESEATRYAEDVPEAKAERLKVAQMFAAFVSIDRARSVSPGGSL